MKSVAVMGMVQTSSPEAKKKRSRKRQLKKKTTLSVPHLFLKNIPHRKSVSTIPNKGTTNLESRDTNIFSSPLSDKIGGRD